MRFIALSTAMELSGAENVDLTEMIPPRSTCVNSYLMIKCGLSVGSMRTRAQF